ncbi:polyamine ABC transporter substrate-binding protein [Zavarzinia sp. CC-PAN008]|uniref:polyamine ABC transporter substrate-binding protein n=1 Tax=Zavarzinia sp. CC-PAN008 TaxID=3243332 RepID=UPI003F74AC86
MKRMLAAVALTLLAGPAFAEDKVVNIYNWSDYIDPAVLEDFTKETGIKVVYDVFDSNDILETKLMAGKTGYDIVVPTGAFLARQITAGIFQKLDKSKLPNATHLDADILKRLEGFDPGNEYAIPYMWGTTGIGYNAAKIQAAMPDAPVDSLAMIFDPNVVKNFADCGVYVLDAPDEIIPAALKYLGEDPNSKDPAVIAKAQPVLDAIRPYIRKFHSSQYINDIANGEICLAMGWSGDFVQAQAHAEEAKNGIEIKYSIPKEGALMWFDTMAIPADAPHVEEAYAFLNYIMRPEVIAKASNFVGYANGNKDAPALMDAAVTGNPSVYPPAATIANLFTVSPYDQKSQRALTRLWTSVKGG